MSRLRWYVDRIRVLLEGRVRAIEYTLRHSTFLGTDVSTLVAYDIGGI